ncbi:MAG: helix-turn-helix transcriptional regulator [Paenibacillus macerans]|uniref:DUF4325 domain-containing protein n=1 Tax=Paenibacillus macerans TaxID=44252 RepID=A0A090ZNV2_PAEMA|nr:helix-turn-helix transcriptional regulator [Paenibacillus macerans]KFN12302.1 hypothetical protein DJ90_2039 [Paenibacillus macerans]MCY7558466.1 helix-turn-helix transcriptional regulator [Paenibacillus macerans]MDU7472156.1 helix-turn-helix transcriptional regulator [Paenibacillus macerans]MEC0150231.1 helix-turn-helix transcriptional regulator [Paenibacillus macerans]MEC0331971.1 helix-turn-helix transcriptional regulator [Paenibacillus macerans]
MNTNMTIIDVGVISRNIIGSDLMFLREQGAKIRAAIEPLIHNAEHDVVALDFSNVKALDFSCSDEVVVFFQEHVNNLKGKGLVLQNLSKNHIENILIALDRKKQAIWYYNGSYWTLLGEKLPKHLTELAQVIREKKTITARQLADELNEDINSQSTKLKKLYDHGLVRRIEEKSSEGAQYIYKSLV